METGGREGGDKEEERVETGGREGGDRRRRGWRQEEE